MNLTDYNEKQIAAITSNLKNVVVVAPPGSGKTTSMVGAIQYYMENNLDAEKIVAITFTVKGAEELKERIKNDKIHISTIHSWSRAELTKLSIKYGFRIKLLEEEQIKSIIKPFMLEKELNPANNYYLGTVYNHCIGMINPDLEPHLKNKYEYVAARYIEFKRKMFVYDFTDLPLYLKTKLEDYSETIEIDALFVDEFQDVDPIQLSVFNRVNSNKKFFIGDVDQAIYRFRGATAEIFEKLEDTFTTYELDVNYRSYQSILDYATNFRKIALKAVHSDSSCSCAVSFPQSKSHIKGIRGTIRGAVYVAYQRYPDHYPISMLTDAGQEVHLKSYLTAMMKRDDFWILARTNKQVKDIMSQGFERVMTIHKSKGLEFDNVIVLDHEIKDEEDVNVGYVALTRARNKLIVAPINIIKQVVKELPTENKTEFKMKRGF